MKLLEEQINDKLKSLDGWKRIDEKWIVKKYRFKAYLDGIAFVNEIAHYAEEKVHHPMISIDYKLITVSLSSWNAGGLTDLDFECAAAYDQMYKTNTSS